MLERERTMSFEEKAAGFTKYVQTFAEVLGGEEEVLVTQYGEQKVAFHKRVLSWEEERIWRNETDLIQDKLHGIAIERGNFQDISVVMLNILTAEFAYFYLH